MINKVYQSISLPTLTRLADGFGSQVNPTIKQILEVLKLKKFLITFFCFIDSPQNMVLPFQLWIQRIIIKLYKKGENAR